MTGFMRRLRARFRNRRFDDDLAEELRFHEEMKREELAATGMSAGDARAAARRELGNVTLMREDSRRVWIGRWLEIVIQDAGYGVRSMSRQPLHSLTVVAVLVLAIGMNTSLFAYFRATVFAPWPAADADRVVRIWARAGSQYVGPSVDEYRFVRDNATTLKDAAAYFVGGGARLQASGRPETYPRLMLVSSNFLDVMGARMQRGSGFLPEDDLPGMRRTPAIISDRLWRTYLNADAGVVGTPVVVNKTPFTIVGVVDAAFDGLERPVDLWLPLSAVPATGMVTAVGLASPASANCCISMVARLADGVDQAKARQEVQLLHERFTTANKRKTGAVDVFGTAYSDMPGRSDLDAMKLVFVALGLVLVLACANVGNLQLARGIARRRELATRTAIGASRGRVVAQLMVEGMVLAGVAGAIALGIAAVAPAAYLRATSPMPELVRARIGVDWALVAVTAAICTLACLVFSLAPALQATRRTIPLGSLDRGSTRLQRFHLRSGFLAVQIGVCTALLIGAGLVTRAIAHATSFDPGYRVHGVQRVSVTLPSETPSDVQTAFARQLIAQLEADAPEPIATGHPGPFTDFPFMLGVALPGEAPQDHRQVARRSVSRHYFDVLGIPFVRGRMFVSDARGEVVVNEAFVRTFWQDRDPIGLELRNIDDKGAVASTLMVVGVVRDAYLAGLDQIQPIVFRPTTSGTLITAGGAPTVERIRAVARALNHSAHVRAWPLSKDVEEFLAQSRYGAMVAWGIGLLGLLLSSVGVLGVFAYSVEERRREIGIRRALGAARFHIVAVLVSTSGRGVLLGLGAGLLLSMVGGTLLRGYLYGLSPLDPLAYTGVLALLGLTAAAATFVPARRACRVDPAVTLREE
jgi:predicted permease